MIFANVSKLCKKKGISISYLEKETGLGNGTVRGWVALYELNKAVIEDTAKENGRASSSNGWWIYPGTVLKLSVSTASSASSTPSTPTPAQTEKPLIKKYTQNDAVMMAKVMFCESRGIKSKTEIACIGWTILNRVDSGQSQFKKSIAGNITAPGPQFAYNASASTRSDYGYDLVALSTDVLNRWSREKVGEQNVGRVLPRHYFWYGGNGKHNYFRTTYKVTGVYWRYSLPSPYES